MLSGAADPATADSVLPALGAAASSALEAITGGFLLNVWAPGRRNLDTPARGVQISLVVLGARTLIGALVGAGRLYLARPAELDNLIASGIGWWLRDAAGALVVAPAIVLWAIGSFRGFDPDKVLSSSVAIVAAILVGLIAFSPLFEQSATRS